MTPGRIAYKAHGGTCPYEQLFPQERARWERAAAAVQGPDLGRLRAALAAYDAVTTYDATVRALSGLAGAAREVCAVSPPEALPLDVPPWLVLFKVDTDPIEVSTHASEADAREFYDRASVAWPEVYLCRVVAGPGPTLPQDAPVAAAPAVAPVEARELDGEAVAGAAEVSDELALAAAREGAQARAGLGHWTDDACLQGPPGRIAAEARSCIGKPYVDARWDDVVRAFVAGARWQGDQLVPADTRPTPVRPPSDDSPAAAR